MIKIIGVWGCGGRGRGWGGGALQLVVLRAYNFWFLLGNKLCPLPADLAGKVKLTAMNSFLSGKVKLTAMNSFLSGKVKLTAMNSL